MLKKQIKEKELIISLIKDNLINTRLVYGLEKLGLDVGNYHVHLAETVLNLMGIGNDSDELFEEYIEMYEQVAEIDIFKYPRLLDSLANGIYRELLKRVNEETPKKEGRSNQKTN